MYGLSLDTDISFFVSGTLIQACFGPHDLILNFQGDKRVAISIWSSIGCVSEDGICRRVEDFKADADFVLKLINTSITAARVLAKGTLCLEFDNGTKLEIYDDSDQYESYSFQCDGKATYV